MSNFLNFKHLRYFWAVAHRGNLTRAAEALNISQSAISIQIQKLEEQLGQDLFERQGKRLILTEAGRIALDYADTIFSAGDELVGTLTQNRPGQKLVLRLGAEATLSRNFQMMFLRPLAGRQDVRVLLRSGPMDMLLQGLESHRFDVVLTNQPPTRQMDTVWIAHELARQNVALVGKRGDIPENTPLEAILTDYPLLLPGRGTPIRDRFDAYISQNNIRIQIIAEVDDMAMLRLLTREGEGIAVIPPIVVRDELESGMLTNFGAIDELYESFSAITLERRFPNPALTELLEAARLGQSS